MSAGDVSEVHKLHNAFSIATGLITLILCAAAWFYPMYQDYRQCRKEGHTSAFCYYLLRTPQ
ncbi:hypothetical protein [Paraburkholderia sp. C35]|uniref:hypothetical protein n=1 Tax=Paraburkholderia sp. C35 TaxID=2126993 RepID=UPI000D6933F8|nr:hypothetical protein [Paraburkholderia sp. C35]